MERIFYTAKVLDTKDKEGMAQIQVSLEGFGPTAVKSPWLRMMTPYASAKFGIYFMPEVGDEVLILKGHGWGPSSMVVLGSLHNGKAKTKVAPDGKNFIKEIRTKSGNSIKFDDKGGNESITIQCKDQALEIKFDAKQKLISITSNKDIKIKSEKLIQLETKDVKIKASGMVDIKAAKDITVNAGGNATIKAAKDVTIKGGMNVKIEGATKVDIKGGAMVVIKGGMVKIN
jgi:type VI secretion system secreted protein VgrG